MKLLPAILFLVIAASPLVALAHCPLCTAASGALAALALWLGVSAMTAGLFIGAFAAAAGSWSVRLIKKTFIPFQGMALILFSFWATMLPLSPFIKDYASFYVYIAGDYGSWLNRTYMVNRFLLGGIIGCLIIVFAPALSNAISKIRKKKFAYQGMAITFLMLLLCAAAIELVI